jgi:predicted MFS family arabinose efflux permease
VVVFAAASVAGFGTASWRVAMGPVLMQVAGPSVRSRAFSWNVALLLASGAVWTALSGSLSAWTAQEASPVGGIRTALWLGAAGTALAGAAFLFLPMGSVATSFPAATGVPSPKRPTLSVPRDVALLVAAVFVWMLGAALVLPFFNLYFQRVHGLSVERIGMIFAAAQALTALVVFLGGELAQRWGPRPTFGYWAAIFPFALLAMVLGPGTWAAVLFFALQGLPSPATNPLLDEIVLDTAPSDRRGAASSWRNGATEASGLVGAALGGLLLERLGFGPLLSVAAVVAAAGAWALSRSFARSAR